MIFDSVDDLRCLEDISNEDEYTMNTLFEDKQLQALLEVRVCVFICSNLVPNDPYIYRLFHFEFQLYDFISSRCLSSLPRPPKDAYYRYREIIDILRDIDDSYSFANNDTLLKRIVHELLEILTRSHFKVNL